MTRLTLPLLIAALAAPASAIAQTAAPANGPQLVIAHRGASGYAPEHTLFAYDMAVAMDVDMLECDLFLTKDEVPVCIHDPTVQRTSDGTGDVSSFTLAELRQLDFGSWFNEMYPDKAKPEYVGAKIVPYEEQLDCYLRLNPRMRFHTETKDSAGGRAEQVMVDLLTRKGLIATGDVDNGNVQSSTIVLQSFDAGSLERMRQLAPTIPTAFLYPGTAPGTSAATTAAVTGQAMATGDGPDYVDAYAPNSSALTNDPDAVARFHAAGHDVHTWTVNDAPAMNELLDMGVDGIFTNFADVLRAEVDKRGTGTTKEQRGNPADFTRGCPGIAGRVTSNQGPGDVWEPTGTRGVRLVSSASESYDSGSGLFMGGGSPALALLAVLALGFAVRHSRR
jgi:glycerophosphoryl diester phosphodiesterase